VEFTLDELTAQVAARLDRAGFAQGNGQVSPVPDRRTLRYYTTIGLLDRPLAIRDRQAVYGERHVLQALAVKRLQALGRSLAEIQAQLAGLPDQQLDALARPDQAGPSEGSEPAARRSARFWAAATPEASLPDLRTLVAVPLDGDVSLLVPSDRPLTPADVAAVRQAAEPLLRYLTAAGLTHPQSKECP
jgi:DNA-binding transcriptional MerR regulator